MCGTMKRTAQEESKALGVGAKDSFVGLVFFLKAAKRWEGVGEWRGVEEWDRPTNGTRGRGEWHGVARNGSGDGGGEERSWRTDAVVLGRGGRPWDELNSESLFWCVGWAAVGHPEEKIFRGHVWRTSGGVQDERKLGRGAPRRGVEDPGVGTEGRRIY